MIIDRDNEMREKVNAHIDAALAQKAISPEDLLALTVARRLNNCCEATFRDALGGRAPEAPLNFWGKR